MKASDMIVQVLKQRGVSRVYELCGGMLTHLLDSLHLDGGIEIVSLHHEQSAAFAAEAEARVAGVPGVALATSGPGATNLLTGIGSCYFDSTPAVFITGQVNRSECKNGRPVRQLGFQELDVVAMATPVTKAAWRVDDPDTLAAKLVEAFRLALEGRPGPVLLDIPMDVQRAEIAAPERFEHDPLPAEADAGEVESALEAISLAERPLILAGGGIRASRSFRRFRRFVERVQVPVVYSLMAPDVLSSSHPLRVGMIGTYGNRWANLALGRSDLLLILGSRLDIRQTGADVEAFKAGKTVIHVDVDAGEINNRVTGCRPVVANLRTFLQAAGEIVKSRGEVARPAWRDEIDALRAEHPDTDEQRVDGIPPNRLMHQIAAVSGLACAYVTDVGQHQVWAAQSLEFGDEQQFLTSGGMGAMGFGLPAAIGATLTTGAPVVLITGDGSFQVNLQELEVVARRELPVKIVLLNNRSLGMVRQFQQSYFDSRFASTVWGVGAPDFVRVAEGFKVPARRVERPEEVEDALAWLWRRVDRPALLDVSVSPEANAYPKIAFGSPITEMDP